MVRVFFGLVVIVCLVSGCGSREDDFPPLTQAEREQMERYKNELDDQWQTVDQLAKGEPKPPPVNPRPNWPRPNPGGNPNPRPKPKPVVPGGPEFTQPPRNTLTQVNPWNQPDIQGNTINLISLVDIKKDAGNKWAFSGKLLVCHTGSFRPRVRFQYQPPEEYDYVMKFSQPGLRNGIALIMPKPQGGHFLFYVGGRDGGCSFLGKPDVRNRTEPQIQPGRIYTTKVEVRKGVVRGYLEGKLYLEHKTDFSDLQADHWNNLHTKQPIVGLSVDDPTTLHEVKIIEVTGKGKVLPRGK